MFAALCHQFLGTYGSFDMLNLFKRVYGAPPVIVILCE